MQRTSKTDSMQAERTQGRRLIQESLQNKYYESFNFYFAKPLNEILTGARTSPAIAFRDYAFYDNKIESLRRWYTTPESKLRLNNYADFFAEINKKYYPYFNSVEGMKVLGRRVYRLHRLRHPRESGSPEGGEENAATNHVLKELYQPSYIVMDYSFELERPEGKQLDAVPSQPVSLENQNEHSWATSVHDIYSPRFSTQPPSVRNSRLNGEFLEGEDSDQGEAGSALRLYRRMRREASSMGKGACGTKDNESTKSYQDGLREERNDLRNSTPSNNWPLRISGRAMKAGSPKEVGPKINISELLTRSQAVSSQTPSSGMVPRLALEMIRPQNENHGEPSPRAKQAIVASGRSAGSSQRRPKATNPSQGSQSGTGLQYQHSLGILRGKSPGTASKMQPAADYYPRGSTFAKPPAGESIALHIRKILQRKKGANLAVTVKGNRALAMTEAATSPQDEIRVLNTASRVQTLVNQNHIRGLCLRNDAGPVAQQMLAVGPFSARGPASKLQSGKKKQFKPKTGSSSGDFTLKPGTQSGNLQLNLGSLGGTVHSLGTLQLTPGQPYASMSSLLHKPKPGTQKQAVHLLGSRLTGKHSNTASQKEGVLLSVSARNTSKTSHHRNTASSSIPTQGMTIGGLMLSQASLLHGPMSSRGNGSPHPTPMAGSRKKPRIHASPTTGVCEEYNTARGYTCEHQFDGGTPSPGRPTKPKKKRTPSTKLTASAASPSQQYTLPAPPGQVWSKATPVQSLRVLGPVTLRQPRQQAGLPN